MKKMQWPVLKIIPAVFALVIACSSPVYSQISSYRLQMADSLFNAKQFTQALGHYKAILSQKEYTPAMLLKMAFVEEGLSHIGEAMYYLNLYYLATGDEMVLERINHLATSHKLAGYALDETGQAVFVYQRYHDRFSLGIVAVIFFLFSLAVFLKRRQLQPLPVTVMLLVFCALLGLHLLMKDTSERVIVTGENSYLMAGPSGAAPVVDVISGGHRLEIEKRHDVWMQVRWNGRRAFIKNNRVLPVQL